MPLTLLSTFLLPDPFFNRAVVGSSLQLNSFGHCLNSFETTESIDRSFGQGDATSIEILVSHQIVVVVFVHFFIVAIFSFETIRKNRGCLHSVFQHGHYWRFSMPSGSLVLSPLPVEDAL